MGLDLGRKFPVTFAGIPPHVSQNDLRLWEGWRTRFAKDYVNLYFDVGVGAGSPAPPDTPDNLAEAWRRLTGLRIDLIAESATGWDLIEFRPNAGAGALGAVQVYSTLWKTDPPDQRPLRVLVVTDFMSPDVLLAASLAGVEVIQLGGV